MLISSRKDISCPFWGILEAGDHLHPFPSVFWFQSFWLPNRTCENMHRNTHWDLSAKQSSQIFPVRWQTDGVVQPPDGSLDFSLGGDQPSAQLSAAGAHQELSPSNARLCLLSFTEFSSYLDENEGVQAIIEGVFEWMVGTWKVKPQHKQ